MKTEKITKDEMMIMESMKSLFSLSGKVDKDAFYWNKGKGQNNGPFNIHKLQFYWVSHWGCSHARDTGFNELTFQSSFGGY